MNNTKKKLFWMTYDQLPSPLVEVQMALGSEEDEFLSSQMSGRPLSVTRGGRTVGRRQRLYLLCEPPALQQMELTRTYYGHINLFSGEMRLYHFYFPGIII